LYGFSTATFKDYYELLKANANLQSFFNLANVFYKKIEKVVFAYLSRLAEGITPVFSIHHSLNFVFLACFLSCF